MVFFMLEQLSDENLNYFGNWKGILLHMAVNQLSGLQIDFSQLTLKPVKVCSSSQFSLKDAF